MSALLICAILFLLLGDIAGDRAEQDRQARRIIPFIKNK